MRRTACLAFVILGLGSPALADGQFPSPEEIARRDMVTVGLGVAIIPDYEGSNDYRVIPAGAVRGTVSGISFTTRGAYLYVDLVPQRGSRLDFNAGPAIGVRLGTRRHIHDQVVELLPRRKTAIEAGGFVGLSVHDLTNPYDTLGVRLDILHDINGAHKSTVLSPNVEFSTPLSRTTYASAYVGMEFVSKRFADYYFSISPADSSASGLPVFNAGGGLKNWKAGFLLNQSITGDLLHGISIFGLGEYSRLVGDSKSSPIVSQRGSADQWTGAAGLAYTW